MTHAQVLVEDLLHDYGRGPVLAIDHLALGPGIHHLAGPNGAGKTTLLRILATLTTPTRGRLRVAGHDPRQAGEQVRARTGYLGHRPSLHPQLTAREALDLHARLHGLDPTAVDRALATWELTAHHTTPLQALSHGQARRVDLARATLHTPPVLLLDEPATGLDAASIERLREHLQERRDRLVLLTGHGQPLLPPDTTLRLDGGHLQGASP